MRFWSQLLTGGALLGLLAIGAWFAVGGSLGGGSGMSEEEWLAAQPEFEAPGPLTDGRFFVVEGGSIMGPTARRLEADGAIPSSSRFLEVASYKGVAGALKAGTFYIPPQASMDDVLNLITGGVQISIEKGWTAGHAIAALNASSGLSGEPIAPTSEEFDAIEGRVAPGAWRFAQGTDRRAALDALIAEQDRILAELWARYPQAAESEIQTPRDALILASVMQRETSLDPEYPIVASALHARLKANDFLGVDAAIIYGLERRDGDFTSRRDLRTRDLRDASNRWNSRVHRGLPPTPISNPGREAIAAVLNPADTDCYYFVADGTGGHAFGRNDREHGANRAIWDPIDRVLQTNGSWTLDVAPIRRIAPSEACDADFLAGYEAAYAGNDDGFEETMSYVVVVTDGMSVADVAAAVEAATFIEGDVVAPTDGVVTPGIYRVRPLAPRPSRQLVLDYLLSGR